MRDSWQLAGGVQGMRGHDEALQQDGDGDQACSSDPTLDGLEVALATLLEGYPPAAPRPSPPSL